MKHLLFYSLLKSKKLPSKRIIFAGIAIVSVLLLGTLAATGYFVWTAGKYAVSKVQHYVPNNVPATIDSTVKKIQEGAVLHSCKSTLMGLFALEPWLSQPLAVTFNKIKTDCWADHPAYFQNGEQI